MAEQKPTTFFNDGKKKIDYVLVYSSEDIEADHKKSSMLSTYLQNIKTTGLEIEQEKGKLLDDLMCVKVHAPKKILNNCTGVFKMELSMNNPNYKYHRKVPIKFMDSIVTSPDSSDPLTQRAPDTLSGNKPTDFTNAERIFIVQKLLSQVAYDEDQSHKGFKWLITEKVLIDAYPLHDSLADWTEEGPLTDRQILGKYWASAKYFYKEQPLTLIERYYGPAVAFYFAWVEYYTIMLVPAAFIGLICFFSGIIYYQFDGDYIVKDVCKSNQLLCPVCPTDDYCSFTPIKEACGLMKFTYIMVENPINVIYSVLMTFWGVLFVILWNRKEAQLSLRWNLNEITRERDLRLEFKKEANVQRISSITGKMEYYFSFWNNVYRKFIIWSIMLIMLIVYLFGVTCIIYYRLAIRYYGARSENQVFKDWHTAIELLTAPSISITMIIVFNSFKGILCQKLTEFENPRTAGDFERKYNLKFTILTFGNIFFPAMYLAFFRGRFYTHPGDATQWTPLGIIKADRCKLSGCLIDLTIQMVVLLLIHNVGRPFFEFIIPLIKVHCKYRKLHKDDTAVAMQWEEDFILMAADYSHPYCEYVHLVVQYGLLTLFLVSLPLMPVIALILNIIEIRLDAIKIVKKYRRVVWKKSKGIEQWNELLKYITVFGTISNPLLVAYSSSLISRYIYLHYNSDMRGFINTTLSEFLVSDYPWKENTKLEQSVESCFYVGKRNPPSDPNKYERSDEYWYHYAIKAIFFIAMENICLLSLLFLKNLIPVTPRKVKLKREYNERLLQEERLKHINA